MNGANNKYVEKMRAQLRSVAETAGRLDGALTAIGEVPEGDSVARSAAATAAAKVAEHLTQQLEWLANHCRNRGSQG